jgi:hypothetical protein
MNTDHSFGPESDDVCEVCGTPACVGHTRPDPNFWMDPMILTAWFDRWYRRHEEKCNGLVVPVIRDSSDGSRRVMIKCLRCGMSVAGTYRDIEDLARVRLALKLDKAVTQMTVPGPEWLRRGTLLMIVTPLDMMRSR